MGIPNALFSSVSLTAGNIGEDARATLHLGQSFDVPIAGRTVSLRLDGTIDLTASLSGHMDTKQVTVYYPWPPWSSDETVVDLSRSPSVSGSVTASAHLTADVDGVAASLYGTLDPASAGSFASDLVKEACKAVEAALGDGTAALAGVLGNDHFPFWGELPQNLKDTVGNQVATRFSDGLKDLKQRFSDALRLALTTLDGAVERVARDALASLEGDLARALGVLSALGKDVAAAVADVEGRIAAWVAQGKAFFDQCVALLESGFADAATLLAEVVAGARDVWGSARDRVQALVRHIADGIGGEATALRDFGLRALGVLADRLGDALGGAAEVIFDVAMMLRALFDAAWADTGALFGVLLTKLDAAGADLGGLLGRLFGAIRVSKEELFELMKHLGSDPLVKKVARWMLDAWQTVAPALRSGVDEVKKLLQYLCGIVEKLPPPPLPPGFDKVLTLVRWIESNAQTLVSQPADLLLADYQALRRRLLDGKLAEGLYLLARRDGHSVVDAAHQLLDDGNALAKVAGAWGDALGPLWGQAQDGGAEAYRTWISGVSAFFDCERALDALVFGGGLPHDTPAWVGVTMTGWSVKPLEVPQGVEVRTEPPTVSDVLDGAGDAWVGLVSEVSADISTITFKGDLTRLAVPGPTDTSSTDYLAQPAAYHATFPYGMTLLPSAYAIAHLPEVWVLDMRYEMPYGDVGSYKVVDLDGDGFVRDAEVAQVRAAATAGPDAKYQRNLDCNGDGRIDADDVQLATEQRTRYVNGKMWRPITAPVGLWMAPLPGAWVFVMPFTSAAFESLPGKIERLGALAALEAQLLLPYAPGKNYPLRAHLELREVLDCFPGDLAIGGVPLPGFPTMRADMVLRGGDGGRDFQVSAWAQSPNPLLRTFTLKGTFYLKAMLSGLSDFGLLGGVATETAAGVSGKGDLKLFVEYETSEPLIVVLEEWHDRLASLFTTPWADLLPFDLIKAVLEWTNLPRIFRGILAIAGPITDLLFSWADPDHLRGVMAYIRQVTLTGYKPCPSYRQVLDDVNGWKDLPEGLRAAVVSAVREEQASMRTAVNLVEGLLDGARGGIAGGARHFIDDDTPFYTPARCFVRMKAAVERYQPPPPGRQRPEGPLVVAGAEQVGAELAAQAHQRAQAAAVKRLVDYFSKDRQRFSAGLEQLVPDLDKELVEIPLCGRFTIKKAHVITSQPFQKQMPFKPIYRSLVRFGTDVVLYGAPRVSKDLEVLHPDPKSMASVEGARALVSEDDGAWWLFVRTDDKKHGWLRLPADVIERVHRDVELLGLPLSVMAPDLLADLQDEVAKGTAKAPIDDVNKVSPIKLDHVRESGVTRIMMAPADISGDNDELGLVVKAMTGPDSEHARQVRDLYGRALWELKVRLYGVANAGKSDDELRKTWEKLDFAKREALWTQLAGWMQCSHLAAILGQRFLDDVVPPLMKRDAEAVWNAFLVVLAGVRDDFDVLDAAQVAFDVTPRIIEVVKLIVQTVARVIKLVKAAKDKDLGIFDDLGGSGSLHQARASSDTIATLGLSLLRLLVDDEAAPGSEPRSDDPQPGHRKSRDHAITFSVKAEGFATPEDADKAKKDDEQEKKDAETSKLALVKHRAHMVWNALGQFQTQMNALIAGIANPMEARIEHAFVTDLPDEIYRIMVGQVQWEATRSLTWEQRRDRWLKLAWQSVDREIIWRTDPLADALDRETAYRLAIGPEVYPTTRGLDWPAREEHYHGLVGDDWYEATRDLSWSQRVAYSQMVCEKLMVSDDLEWAQTQNLLPAERRDYWARKAWRQTVGEDGWEATKDMTWDQRKAWAEAQRLEQATGEAADKAPAPDKAPPPKKEKVKEVDIALNFGADKLTIKFSTEAGAGVAAGDAAGAEVDAGVHGNFEPHFAGPTFSVKDLITDRNAITIMIRFALRFFHHLLDAVNLAIGFAKTPAASQLEWLEGFADTGFWVGVFTLFAMRDAMGDIVADHAKWLAKFLESIEWSFSFDASVSAGTGAWGHADIKEKVTGKCKVPLSVLLAPVIEFLCATTPRRGVGKALSDLIIPRITFEVVDATTAKVGAFPVHLEIESRGKLAAGELAIPQGSPLRAKIEALGDLIGTAADHFKANRLQSVREEVRAVRTFLDLLDHGIKDTIEKDVTDAAMATAGPLVQLIMDALQNKATDAGAPPSPAGDTAHSLAAALASSHARGYQVKPGPILIVDTVKDQGSTLTIWMDEDEKARFDAAGFQASSAVPRLENATFHVPLGVRPRAVLWSTYHDPMSLEPGLEQGIAAAFDTGDAARDYASARSARHPDWVGRGASKDAVWSHDDLWLTWIETDLVGKLTGAKCALPEIAADGEALVLTFPLAPVDAAEGCGAAVLAAASARQRQKIIEVVLMTGANAAEVDLVRAQLDANRAAPGG